MGGLGHFAFVVVNILPSWKNDYPDDEIFFQKEWFVIMFLFIGSVINGATAPFLWVAQGHYIANCAPIAYKGYYFGLYWSFYQGSQVFGSLAGAMIFKNDLNKTWFFIIMSGVALLAALSFPLLRTPTDVKSLADHDFEID